MQQPRLSWYTRFDVERWRSHDLLRLCLRSEIAIDLLGYGLFWGFFLRVANVLTLVQISVTALCCMFLTLSRRFGAPNFRHWRAIFYAAFGLSSVSFVIHRLMLHGWELQDSRMSLTWMYRMAAANLLGAAIYATRVSVRLSRITRPLIDMRQIPERWVPYKFDICGASHQLFHIAVMVAAWLHFFGLVQSFRKVRSVHHSCDIK